MAITYLNIPLNMKNIIDLSIHGVIKVGSGEDSFCEMIDDYGESELADFYSIYARMELDDKSINPLDAIADCDDYDTAYRLCCDLRSIMGLMSENAGKEIL